MLAAIETILSLLGLAGKVEAWCQAYLQRRKLRGATNAQADVNRMSDADAERMLKDKYSRD